MKNLKNKKNEKKIILGKKRRNENKFDGIIFLFLLILYTFKFIEY